MTVVQKCLRRNLIRSGHMMMMVEARMITAIIMLISTFLVRMEECLKGSQIATYLSKAMARRMPDSMHWKVCVKYI